MDGTSQTLAPYVPFFLGLVGIGSVLGFLSTFLRPRRPREPTKGALVARVDAKGVPV